MMTKDGLIFEANSLKQGRLQALTRQQLQAQATQNRERRWGPSTFSRYQRARGPVRSPTDWLQLVNQPQTEAEVAALRCCVNRGRPFGDPH